MSHYATAKRIKAAASKKSHAALREYFRVNGFDKQPTPMKIKYEAADSKVIDNTIQDIVNEILDTKPRVVRNRRINRVEALVEMTNRQREIAERERVNPTIFGSTLESVRIARLIEQNKQSLKHAEQLIFSFPRLVAKGAKFGETMDSPD